MKVLLIIVWDLRYLPEGRLGMMCQAAIPPLMPQVTIEITV